ncbi:unnamed protein product [Sympodiomycopsis kandeliae]
MPQETIQFPAAYVVVGAYRLLHDPALWKPMWADLSVAAKKVSMVAAAWGVLTWPIQRAFVALFMKGSGRVLGFSGMYSSISSHADKIDDSLPFNIPLPSLQGFATFMFVLSQCSTLIEFWLRRRLRQARTKAYGATVESRGKAADWWSDYYEEWETPPTEKAMKQAKKQAFYTKLATPIIRMVILKVFLLPLDWIPFFSLGISAYIRSLSLARQLHTPLFAAKRMTPLQVEVWITERSWHYRMFGFTAALFENIPLLGIFFSISNRVGAAMYAHDLEKRQQLFHRGQLKPLSPDQTYSLQDPRKPSSPKSSQMGKLPVAPQGDDTFAMPGATLGQHQSQSQSPTQSSQYPSIPRPIDSESAQPPPPSYDEAQAEQVIAGSGSAAGGLGLAPSHADQTGGSTRRRVPPLPSDKKT